VYFAVYYYYCEGKAVIINQKEIKMIEETLQNLVNAVENLSDLNVNPDNSFGVSLGDQVYELTYEVKRIADVLEQIYSKMK
jgi:hypothetical protein